MKRPGNNASNAIAGKISTSPLCEALTMSGRRAPLVERAGGEQAPGVGEFRAEGVGTPGMPEAISFTLRCSSCRGNELTLMEDESKCSGLCSMLELRCVSCRFQHRFTTSRRTDPSSEGRSFEVNRRAAFGGLLMGGTRHDIHKFTAAMNMPPPSLPDSWNFHVKACNI